VKINADMALLVPVTARHHAEFKKWKNLAMSIKSHLLADARCGCESPSREGDQSVEIITVLLQGDDSHVRPRHRVETEPRSCAGAAQAS
jgi:hypothetical protein